MLSIEERDEFAEAASAFLAKKEKLEFIQDKIATESQGQAESRQITHDEVAEFMGPGMRLRAVLVKLMEKYGRRVPAVRFRGHIFSLRTEGDRLLGTDVWKESTIESIEG